MTNLNDMKRDPCGNNKLVKATEISNDLTNTLFRLGT